MNANAAKMAWHLPCKGNCLLLALAIAQRADDRGLCQQSLDDLASLSRIGARSALKRHMRTLRELGFIHCIRKGGGRNRTTIYRVRTGPVLRGTNINAGHGLASPRRGTPPEPPEPGTFSRGMGRTCLTGS
jgi:hypothetical protein